MSALLNTRQSNLRINRASAESRATVKGLRAEQMGDCRTTREMESVVTVHSVMTVFIQI